MKIENQYIRLQISDSEGSWELTDKRAGVHWHSAEKRFGTVEVQVGSDVKQLSLIPSFVTCEGHRMVLSFHDNQYGRLALYVTVTLKEESLEFTYRSSGEVPVKSITLLDHALDMLGTDAGYLLVPVRLGLLIPSDSGKAFTHRFGTYDYEGCHMAMLGAVKNGGALLVTWDDPYVISEVNSEIDQGEQKLTASLILSKSADTVHIHVLGSGNLNTIAQAYRELARGKGWLVPWKKKLEQDPKRAELFGAINFKLWHALARRIDEDLNEISVNVEWTFDEVAQIAEHLKNDLDLERVLFILGGWIHKGYDCQHPDILPAAPECGGNEKLQECIRRVENCGYLFGMHDNYQDMYRDAPSWNEDDIMKAPDGSLVEGGLWLGGRAFLTCSQKAVDLAKRPQNLPAVKQLFNPDAYFIDTTYAAGLYECYDADHPLSKQDDMYWKQVISDYARDVFGIFGSECGREWAIPHADWFEGITGVSGQYYHFLNPDNFGATVVPIFEMVYRDCIAAHGKYSYKNEEAAEYVLHHISIGRTLNHHNIGRHLYWKDDTREEAPIPATGEPDIACFTRGDNGWTEGMCMTDRFVKNTYEILSPLNELTSCERITSIVFLNEDMKIRETRFGEENRVVVNGSCHSCTVTSKTGGKINLPPFGFLVELPDFVAFYAASWGGIEYDRPVLFTLRSKDGKPISCSSRIRVFHGFGDDRIIVRGKVVQVKREAII